MTARRRCQAPGCGREARADLGGWAYALCPECARRLLAQAFGA